MGIWNWPPDVLNTNQIQNLAYGNGSRPLWLPPAVADTDNDEFNSTDSAALLAKYIFRDRTTGPTNRTPVFGSFDETTQMSGAATVPNVALHTQGRSSWMSVQTTVTGPASYAIVKPFTWRAGRNYWCRVGTMVRRSNDTPVSVSYPSLCLVANLAGVPDFNNYASVGYDLNGVGTSGGVPCLRYTTVVGGGAANNVTIPLSEGFGIMPYLLFANPANVLGGAATWYGDSFNDDGCRVTYQTAGGMSFSFTPAWIGWLYSGALGSPGVMQVDFLRASANHPLMHPY